MYYAQLNKDGICVAISDLATKTTNSDMIPLKNFDADLIGKQYNSGSWININEDLPEPEMPITNDQLNEQIIKLTKDNQILGQMLTEILINQMKVSD